MPSVINEDSSYNLVEYLIKNYWTFEKAKVLEFSEELLKLTSENNPSDIFTQIENYMRMVLKENFNNKQLFYRVLKDIEQVEVAKRQIGLPPSMNLAYVCENLSYKMFLE